MQLDPTFVLPDSEARRAPLSRRSLLALLGAGGAAAVGVGLGYALGPPAPEAVRGSSDPATEAAELEWALALATGEPGPLAAARAPFLFVLARTADPRLLDGAEQLAALACAPHPALALDESERSALLRQLRETLRVSGLVGRSPRAAALAARLGGRR